MPGGMWSFRPVVAVAVGAVLLVSGCSAGKDSAADASQGATALSVSATSSPSVSVTPSSESKVATSASPAASEATSATPEPAGDGASVAPDVASPAESPAPAESPVQAIQPPAVNPAEAAPGTSCGPSSTGASTLVVASNGTEVTCDQVQSIFAEFNTTFTSGDTSNYQIQGFTCHTRSQKDVLDDARSVTCTQGGTRLEAMTYYPLGGIPVQTPAAYRTTPEDIVFTTDTMSCRIWSGTASHVSCSLTYQGQPSEAVFSDTYISRSDDSFVRNAPQIRPAQSASITEQGKYLGVNETISEGSVACINHGQSVECAGEAYSGFIVSENSFQVR